MRIKFSVLLIVLLLSGCGCGFSKGDIVVDKLTGETGVIEMVYSGGMYTEECQLAIRYKDRRELWVYGFYFNHK